MTTTREPTRITVALVDVTGDQLDGTLWGAVRTGGWVALVVGEYDHLTRAPADPPTPAAMRALADALDGDTDPRTVAPEGSRRWWRNEAKLRQAEVDDERRRAEAAEQAAADLRVSHERELAEAGAVRQGAVRLIRAATAVEERQYHRRELDVLRRALRGKAIIATAVALLAGLAIGRWTR